MRDAMTMMIPISIGLLGCGSSTSGGNDQDAASDAFDAAPAEVAKADVATADTATADVSSIPAVCVGQLMAMTEACRTCIADQCMREASDCCAVTTASDGGADGCLPLAVCALRTKCKHASCADPSTCGKEVDGAGGPFGEATNVAAGLGACIETSAKSMASCAECLK